MEVEKEYEIVEECKKDLKSFSQIYKEYAADVYRYAYAVVENSENAEEIAQKTFLVALEKICQYESRGISIKYWLLKIARNLIYKTFAKKEIIMDEEVIESMPEVQKASEQTDVVMQKDVAEALSKLPDTTREIIILKIWQEYKFNEIAELTGMDLGAVKMQFYRGTARLKEILEKKGYDKNYLVYPLLFKGVMDAQSLKIYQPDINLASKFGDILNQVSGAGEGVSPSNIPNLNSINKMSSKVLGYIAAGVLGVTGVAGTTYVVTTQLIQPQNSVPTEVVTTVPQTTANSDECPLCSDCPSVTPAACPGNDPVMIETTYQGYSSKYNFKYSYPSDWSVAEDTDTRQTQAGNYYTYTYLSMDQDKIYNSSDQYKLGNGKITSTDIYGYECTGTCVMHEDILKTYPEAKKLDYSLKVSGAVCYQYKATEPTEGLVQTCVFDFPQIQGRFVLKANANCDLNVFKKVAESISE